MRHHYVYKITNTANGKFYIGVHSTNNIDDGYMGSGTALKRAIKKYGIESFNKEVLNHFRSRQEALEHEASLVTSELVEDSNCYNIDLGGRNSRAGFTDCEQTRKRKSDAIKKFHREGDRCLYLEGMSRVDWSAVAKKTRSTSDSWSTPEYKEKARKVALSNPAFVAMHGHKITAAGKEAISKFHKGRKWTPEHKQNLREAQRARWARYHKLKENQHEDKA